MRKLSEKKRKTGLDALKYLCCLPVICAHVPFPGKGFADPFIRVAVPVFFAITGYFYTDTVRRGAQDRQIKKLSCIYGLSFLGLLLFAAVTGQFGSGSFVDKFLGWSTPKNWLSLIFFGAPPFATHLWYMPAIILTLLTMKLLTGRIAREKLHLLILPLLLINFALGRYSELLFSENIAESFSRNFLFMGIPFLLLGDMIREYEDKLKARLGYGVLLLAFFGGLFLAAAEIYILVSAGRLANGEAYFGTLLSPAALMLIFLKLDNSRAEKWLRLPARWGQQYSLGIYICHMAVNELLPEPGSQILPVLPLFNIAYQIFYPIVLLAVSTLAVATVQYAWKKLRAKA